MTHWINPPEDINDWYGFTYEICNKISGMKYIGRKYFHTYKKGKRTKESNWSSYTSSSKEVNGDIIKYGIENFSFLILKTFKTRQEVNYAEVEEQIKRNVLKSILPSGEFEYYNKNIMSKFFRPKDYGTPEYEAKIKALSLSLKEKYIDGYRHPLLGKVHPSKGKKLPQTGHSKNRGKFFITDGVSNTSIRMGDTIPDGWKKGMTKKPTNKPIKTFELTCDYCGVKKVVPSKKKENKYCSSVCQQEAHSIRMKNKTINENQSDSRDPRRGSRSKSKPKRGAD